MLIATGLLDHPLDHRFSRAAGFPYWTLATSLRGTMRLTTGRGVAPMHAGDVMLVRPDSPYEISLAGGRRWSECYLIFGPRPDWLRWLDWPEVLPGVMKLEARRDVKRGRVLLRTLQDVHRLAKGTRPERDAFAENALERALLWAHTLNPRAPFARRDERVSAALNFLAQHLAEQLSVERLAQAVHLSPSRLAHIFRQEMGEAPMSYLERLRIQRAQQLLVGTNQPIHAIAEEVGFEDPYHFSTRFRKRTGKAPRNYRQRPGQETPTR